MTRTNTSPDTTFDIVSAGELLAEFVAEHRDQSFTRQGHFIGPFPSGAPAIFASQAARMGARVAFAGCVGADDFGAMILERLAADGIDTAAVGRDPGYPTATSFVRYKSDGERDFIFNLTHSAAARLHVDDDELDRLADCRFFHVMGSSLNAKAPIELIDTLVERVRRRGGRISFDPNVRPELLGDPASREAILRRIDDCDVLLPSEADIAWLRREEDTGPEDTITRLLRDKPMSLVVLKRAGAGSEAFSAHGRLQAPALRVEERDPTGAGDCYGGALIAALIAGEPLSRALALASAAGAHAVTRTGPMAGCCDRATLDALIKEKAPT